VHLPQEAAVRPVAPSADGPLDGSHTCRICKPPQTFATYAEYA
jgi:hypothetical protein